jgi:HSP90 family molecular chaperone
MSGSTQTPSYPSGPGKFCDSISKSFSNARTRSEPKDVTEAEYLDFYRSTFKDYRKPIGWHHFAGDAAGTSFKGIIFLPEKMFVASALYLYGLH